MAKLQMSVDLYGGAVLLGGEQVGEEEEIGEEVWREEIVNIKKIQLDIEGNRSGRSSGSRG